MSDGYVEQFVIDDNVKIEVPIVGRTFFVPGPKYSDVMRAFEEIIDRVAGPRYIVHLKSCSFLVTPDATNEELEVAVLEAVDGPLAFIETFGGTLKFNENEGTFGPVEFTPGLTPFLIEKPCEPHNTVRCGYCHPPKFDLEGALEGFRWQHDNASGTTLSSDELVTVIGWLEELQQLRRA